MILYIGKLITCSGLLYLIYWSVLRNQKLLVFNRFYLLGIIPLSVIIPLIKIVVPFDVPNLFNNGNNATHSIAAVNIQQTTDSTLPHHGPTDWYSIALLIYAVIALALLLKQLLLYRKFLAYIHAAAPSNDQSIYVITGLKTAFSFFQKIYVPKEPYQQGIIDQSIIAHEQAHANQYHSVDVLFMQLSCILLWFNPFIYLIQKSIRQTHEYLADHAVVQVHEKLRYQHLIIEWSISTPDINALPASNFNFLTTKKRLIMLQKRTTKGRLLLMPGLTLLLTAAISILFSTHVEAQKTTPAKTEKEAPVKPLTAPPASRQPGAPKANETRPSPPKKDIAAPMKSRPNAAYQQENKIRFEAPRKKSTPPQKSPKIIDEVRVERIKFAEPQKEPAPSKNVSPIIEEVKVENIQPRPPRRINVSANANVNSNQDLQLQEEKPVRIVLKGKSEVEINTVNKK